MMSLTPAARAFETYVYGYRRTWRGSIMSTFVMPLVYLGAMGFGVGALIHTRGAVDSLGGMSYLEFLAPGMLAASAMQVVLGEVTWPVIAQVKWQKTYRAMIATPLGGGDVVLANLVWVGVRAGMTALATYVAMAVFGLVHTPWSALSVPVGVVTGLAIGTPIYAFAITRQNETSFSLVFRFGMVPLFLFSGTFFPVSQLPAVIQPLAYASPLWHGVDLCRALVAGHPPLGLSLLHVAYLTAWLATGAVLSVRGFRKRMVV